MVDGGCSKALIIFLLPRLWHGKALRFWKPRHHFHQPSLNSWQQAVTQVLQHKLHWMLITIYIKTPWGVMPRKQSNTYCHTMDYPFRCHMFRSKHLMPSITRLTHGWSALLDLEGPWAFPASFRFDMVPVELKA